MSLTVTSHQREQLSMDSAPLSRRPLRSQDAVFLPVPSSLWLILQEAYDGEPQTACGDLKQYETTSATATNRGPALAVHV